jgi:two-component system sensor histidine kinase UhpB
MMFSAAESASGAENYDIEYRRRAKDGSWTWVVDRGMSVTQENGVRYATGVFWDTTRRKRMKEQLRESEERFRQLAENINDVFFLTDVQGIRIYYVSPTFQKIWGFSSEKLYRDPASWMQFVHEDDRRRVRRIVRARRPEMPYDIEFRIRRPDGAVRWIRLRGFPIRDTSGEVLRVAGIAADVTARKEAAEALQRSHQQMRALAAHLQMAREEERKRIAREIHDELGALLLAIKMDAEACRKNGASANANGSGILGQLVERIDAAIDSVRRIATDLRPSILDNLGVLAAVEWEAQDVERRTGIQCVVETDPDQDDLDVEPEPATAIFRIVQEALANVVRHSGATKVKIVLREESGTVKLQITDNGKGIDRESRPGARRWGLVGMVERVSAFNGKLGIDAATPHGTVITATIPARAPHRPRM